MKELAAIFDMDGVIVHTNPHHAKAFEIIFDRQNVPYSEKEFQEHMYGKHNSYIFSYFFKRKVFGEELTFWENEKEGLFREIYKSVAEPLPYLPEFLADLALHNMKTAVATSAPRANMDLVLDTLNLRHYFQSTLASENVELHKPHPEVYVKSAQNLGIVPKDCFVFEDSFSGITAGLNAGMNVIAVLSSHKKEELPKSLIYINDYKDMNYNKLVELSKYVD